MATRFWVGGTGTWDAATTTHWAATSGGTGGQSVPGPSDDVTLDGASGGGIVTVATNFSVNSVTTGAFTGTLDFSANNNSPTVGILNISGTGTRTINYGSGVFTITGNNAIIYNSSTTTGLILNVGTAIFNFSYSGSVGTRTISTGTANVPSFTVSAGTDIFTSSTAAPLWSGNVSFSGFTGTWNNGSGTPTISGNFTLGTGMTITAGTGAITFNSSSATQTITSNGVALNKPITINATAGVTIKLADALNISGATTPTFLLTQGIFDTNNFNVTCGTFSSSNTNTRTLNMGSGTWNLTGTGTIWTTATSTNLTLNPGTSTIICTDTSAAARTVTGNGVAVNNLSISGGTGSFTTANMVVDSLDFTGFTGNWLSPAGSNISVSGNVTLGAGMTTSSGGNVITSIGSGIQTMTSNGVSLNRGLRLNGTGTFILADDLTITNASTIYTVAVTTGTFSTNNKNITAYGFGSSNTNARTINLGSSTITLIGIGTVWDTSTNANITFNAGTSTVVIADTSASPKLFSGDSLTYNNLSFAGGAGILQISSTTSSPKFNRFQLTGMPSTVQIFAGSTITINNPVDQDWSGSAGALNTFQSTTNGSPWFVLSPTIPLNEDYISLQDSAAAGAIPFFAGEHSVNVSGNTNWLFADEPRSAQSAARDANGIPTVILASDADGVTPLRLFVDPTSHGFLYDNTGTGQNYGVINAERDKNFIPVLMGTSSADGKTPEEIYVNTDTNAMNISSI